MNERRSKPSKFVNNLREGEKIALTHEVKFIKDRAGQRYSLRIPILDLSAEVASEHAEAREIRTDQRVSIKRMQWNRCSCGSQGNERGLQTFFKLVKISKLELEIF